jgi:uncharacterized protein YozE (UPF0346 family)
MLQYRSGLLRMMETFAFAPALLSGHTAEKQWIRIEFFDNYFDDPMRPATRIDFQMLSRFVEVYQVYYRIHANFSGIRYLMFRYPLTSAAVGTTINFGFQSLLALLAWLKFFTGVFKNIVGNESDCNSDSSSSDDDDDKAKAASNSSADGSSRKKRSSKRSSGSSSQSGGSSISSASEYGILDQSVQEIEDREQQSKKKK